MAPYKVYSGCSLLTQWAGPIGFFNKGFPTWLGGTFANVSFNWHKNINEWINKSKSKTHPPHLPNSHHILPSKEDSWQRQRWRMFWNVQDPHDKDTHLTHSSGVYGSMSPSLHLEQCLTTVGTQYEFAEWMNEHTEKYGLWIHCCSPVEFSQICASWCPFTPQGKYTNS